MFWFSCGEMESIPEIRLAQDRQAICDDARKQMDGFVQRIQDVYDRNDVTGDEAISTSFGSPIPVPRKQMSSPRPHPAEQEVVPATGAERATLSPAVNREVQFNGQEEFAAAYRTGLHQTTERSIEPVQPHREAAPSPISRITYREHTPPQSTSTYFPQIMRRERVFISLQFICSWDHNLDPVCDSNKRYRDGRGSMCRCVGCRWGCIYGL